MRTFRYEAAGGVVYDGDLVLVLRRPIRREVRLPKGHVDPGETAEQAALREVSEESGYVDLEAVRDLGAQEVRFDRQHALYGAIVVVRAERYWLMRLLSHRTVPRSWEDIEFEPDWLPWDEALAALTFPPEREWVRRGRAALDEP